MKHSSPSKRSGATADGISFFPMPRLLTLHGTEMRPTGRLPGFSIAGIVFTEDNPDIMVQPVSHLDMDALSASVEVPGNPKPAVSI